MPMLRLRPDAGPRQRHHASALVNISGFEMAHQPAAARKTHLVARALEIVRMDELQSAVPHHLVRTIAQDRKGARAYLDEIAHAGDDEDQIERRLENALIDGVGRLQL